MRHTYSAGMHRRQDAWRGALQQPSSQGLGRHLVIANPDLWRISRVRSDLPSSAGETGVSSAEHGAESKTRAVPVMKINLKPDLYRDIFRFARGSESRIAKTAEKRQVGLRSTAGEPVRFPCVGRRARESRTSPARAGLTCRAPLGQKVSAGLMQGNSPTHGPAPKQGVSVIDWQAADPIAQGVLQALRGAAGGSRSVAGGI